MEQENILEEEMVDIDITINYRKIITMLIYGVSISREHKNENKTNDT